MPIENPFCNSSSALNRIGGDDCGLGRLGGRAGLRGRRQSVNCLDPFAHLPRQDVSLSPRPLPARPAVCRPSVRQSLAQSIQLHVQF